MDFRTAKQSFTFGMDALVVAIVVVLFACGAHAADIGDSCQVARSGAQGVCQLINSCQPVIDQIVNQGLFPAQCGFRGRDQIVCCPVPATTTTTTTLRPSRISQISEFHALWHSAHPHTNPGVSAGCHACQCHGSNGNISILMSDAFLRNPFRTFPHSHSVLLLLFSQNVRTSFALAWPSR